ncbi:hypothetical protein D3C71_1746050 [compost metagenome]
MFIVDIFEAVPGVVRLQRPAFSLIDVFWLPDVKEPTFGLNVQLFDFFTELDSTFNRVVNQTLTGIAFHHRRSSFGRCHDTVVR